jgi:hypothetical protein
MTVVPEIDVIDVHHDRNHNEEKKQQGFSQATKTVSEEILGALPIIRCGQEIARYHEEEAHEKRAIDCEEGSQNRSSPRVLEIPKATCWSIGLAGMVSDNESNEGYSKVIDEEQCLSLAHLLNLILCRGIITPTQS